jgi:MscS family membrane protein
MAEKVSIPTLDLTLSSFWEQVTDVWNHGFLGVDVGSIVMVLGIVGIALLVRGIFSKYVLRHLHNWAAKSTTRIDEKIVDALIPPIRFIPVIIGIFFAVQFLQPAGELEITFARMIRSMIAFTIFWALFRAADPVSHSLKKLERILTPSMLSWIFKILKIVVAFIGVAVILEIWGIAVGPLLAGFGLFGVAVALGAQDLFKNLIAGLTIIAEKRFQLGEHILVEGVIEGTVEDIGIRSTKIRRADKAPVHVPNAQLSDTVVVNFSRMSHRRINWKISMPYTTTTQQLKTIRDEIISYIEKNDCFARNEAAPVVRIDAFGASSIDLLVQCFTRTTVYAEWMEIKEELALAVKEIVEEKAGAQFSYPVQNFYIDAAGKEKAEQAEQFVPPAAKKKAND